MDPLDPDSVLMVALQKGDTSAFDQILNKYGRMIVNFLYRFVNDRAEAEDLAQEVFLRVYRARASYEPRAPFSAWIYRIAGNVGIRAARRQHRFLLTAPASDAASDESGAEAFPDTRPSPEQVVSEMETSRIVQRAIHSLPERERMAVILRRYEGLSYKDIAAIMNCTEAAVKTYIHRGKLRLRDRIMPYWRKGGL